MSKKRVNWRGIYTALFLAGGITSMGGMINEYLEYNKLEDSLANLAVKEDGKSYFLTSKGGVVAQTGSLYQTFDFAGRNIAMTGSLLGHELTAFNTFEAYGRSADIEQARNAGCRIASAALNLAASYDPGLVLSGQEKDRLDQARATATTFKQKHCIAQ